MQHCDNRGGSSSEGSAVSLSAFAYVYSELVQYHQGRAASISELERRLESAGYGVGLKVLELVAYRAKEVSNFICSENYFLRFSQMTDCCFVTLHIFSHSLLKFSL